MAKNSSGLNGGNLPATRRIEQCRAADKKRRAEQPWRKWYFTKAWRLKRARQLAKCAWCEPCARLGKSRIATVANHKTPHRGDRELFFRGETESACKNCHDSAIQREEHEGFARSIDADGWPVDPAHPFNRKAARSLAPEKISDDGARHRGRAQPAGKDPPRKS